MSLFKSVKYLDGQEEDAIEITRPGKVLVEFDNGDTFEGTYVQSSDNSGLIRSGQGTYVWKTGGKYEGEYKNGRRNGNGIYVFHNGEKYSGEWLNNVKSGKGKYTYTNGDYFEGTWVGDKRTGPGVFYNAKQQTTVEGEWKDGRLLRDSVKRKPKPEPEVKAPVPSADEMNAILSSGTKKEAPPPVVEETPEEPKQEEPKEEVPEKKEEVVPEEETPAPPKVDEDIKELDQAEAEAEADANANEQTEAPEPSSSAIEELIAPTEAALIEKPAEETPKLDIPFVVIIFGAPASGKGTQCVKIVEKFDLVHISTGDLLRAEKKKATPLGLEIQSFIDDGKLVPNETINKLLLARFSQDDIKQKGLLLDGYPRTVDQARWLKSVGIDVNLFLKLDVDEGELVKRAVGRRMGTDGTIYHIDFKPPPPDIEVIHRKDDQEEKVNERIKTYNRNLGDIQEFYTDQMKVIDGNRDKAEVTEDVLGSVEEAHSKI